MAQKSKTTVSLAPQKPKETKKSGTKKSAKVRKSNKILWSLTAVGAGLFLGWIILVMTGESPFLYYKDMYSANFASWYGFGSLMATMSWLIILGLSMVVSFRAGLFNIGSAGQFIGGGLAGYIVAITIDIGPSGKLISLIIPMAVGMLIGWMIGYLKVRFKIHEVISSIMFNWSIFYVYKYLTDPSTVAGSYVFGGGTTPQTINAGNSLQATWMTAPFNGAPLNWGIFIALGLIILFFILYKFSTWGVKQDILGNNVSASMYAGINESREVIKTMMISGAIAGLAGSVYYLGVVETIPLIGVDIPGLAFNGITIALIGFNNPVGIIFSSFFVGLFTNARTVISTNTNPYISDLVLAITIWTVAIVNYFIIYRPHDKFLNWFSGYDVTKETEVEKLHKKLEKAKNKAQIEYESKVKLVNERYKAFEKDMQLEMLAKKHKELLHNLDLKFKEKVQTLDFEYLSTEEKNIIKAVDATSHELSVINKHYIRKILEMTEKMEKDGTLSEYERKHLEFIKTMWSTKIDNAMKNYGEKMRHLNPLITLGVLEEQEYINKKISLVELESTVINKYAIDNVGEVLSLKDKETLMWRGDQ